LSVSRSVAVAVAVSDSVSVACKLSIVKLKFQAFVEIGNSNWNVCGCFKPPIHTNIQFSSVNGL